uniref:TNF receptor superfamily member 17 n=1 Tax=Panthera tigris altaica TaxID=74533 RepID=A0A8C9KSP2_PANTA
MAQPCFQNEYFDKLLNVCKPCHLRCLNTPPSPCQRYCSVFLANIHRESRTGTKVLLSRGLEYTVEECTCEDCVKNKSKVDSDHSFPLPAMEEGATILVTTKTNDYCNSLVASITEMERSIFTR